VADGDSDSIRPLDVGRLAVPGLLATSHGLRSAEESATQAVNAVVGHLGSLARLAQNNNFDSPYVPCPKRRLVVRGSVNQRTAPAAMKKRHPLRAEAREIGVASEPSRRRRPVKESPPSGPIIGTDIQALAIDDDLNNPLAVVLTNLDLLGDLLPRMQDHSTQHGSLGAKTALAARVAEAQSCLDDAREAGERLRAVAIRVKRASAPPPAPSDTEPPEKSVLRPARILIVDDDEMMARALERVFRGYDVVVHVNPLDALQRLISGERFDIIVSDVMMPAMRGFDLHAEVRRFAPAQADRMLFLTGGCPNDHDAEALSATGQPVLAKPFDPTELRTLVKKFLG
jgi:CheY-like chemotaxis protein